uniref:ParB-like N-terminal domain-containing protein n=1 Tax=viral metagenome TaxID=1070528 RepID=A0A6H1ZXB1_9ZZZZ
MAVKHDAIVSRSNLYMVDPRQIKIQAGWNPREGKLFDSDEERESLKSSIRENGVLVPLHVKKIGEEIILLNGQRRLTCAIELIDEGCEIASVPCLFSRHTISDTEAMFLSVIANDGKRLTSLQEADAFNRLRNWGISVADIAKRIGKSEVLVYRRLLLVDACEALKKEIEAKNINLTEAEEIIKQASGSTPRQKAATETSTKSSRNTFMKPKEIMALYTRTKDTKKDDPDRWYKGYLQALEDVMNI